MKIGNDKYLGVLSPQPTRLLTSGFSYPNSNFGFFLTPTLTSGFFSPQTTRSAHFGVFLTPTKTAHSPRVFLTPGLTCVVVFSPQPKRPAHLTSGFSHPSKKRPAHLGFFSPQPTRPAHLTSPLFFSIPANTACSPHLVFVCFLFFTPATTACSPHLGFFFWGGVFFPPQPKRPAHLGFLSPNQHGLLTSLRVFSHPGQHGLLTSGLPT